VGPHTIDVLPWYRWSRYPRTRIDIAARQRVIATLLRCAGLAAILDYCGVRQV
jgi:hypothetical protein